MCHMAEHKYAKTHYLEAYISDEKGSRAAAVALAHAVFRQKFLDLLGIQYFWADPINGG